MTRKRLNRRLRTIYLLCATILVVAFAARLVPLLPNLESSTIRDAAPLVYEYLRDMALVFVTMVAAYLANVFQKRAKFVSALEQEWRAMVTTKNALLAFCERETSSTSEYLDAYSRISATLDNMRIVYQNVGETNDLIGLYPFAPLHDMRRALEALDPRTAGSAATQAQNRRIARIAIQQSFAGLRETFLEELDLEQPAHSQLVSGAKRTKRPGATRQARIRQKRQAARLEKRTKQSHQNEASVFLAEAYAREQAAETGHTAPDAR